MLIVIHQHDVHLIFIVRANTYAYNTQTHTYTLSQTPRLIKYCKLNQKKSIKELLYDCFIVCTQRKHKIKTHALLVKYL